MKIIDAFNIIVALVASVLGGLEIARGNYLMACVDIICVFVNFGMIFFRKANGL